MGLKGAALRAAAVGLVLAGGMARANGIITNVNFGRGNLDGWAAFGNAKTTSELTAIAPYIVALSRNDDNPAAAALAPGGQAHPLALNFAGVAYLNPLFAAGTSLMPLALPPPAVTCSHPIFSDYATGETAAPTVPAAFNPAINVTPPVPQHLLSTFVGEPAVEAWVENARPVYQNWSFDDPWLYDYGSEPVPEPGTVALFSFGLALLALRGRLPFGRRSRSRDI